MAHAPLLTGGSETSLVGVWGRRSEAAAAIAEQFGTAAVGSYEDLIERSDAIAFAVPPSVQAEMALRAAKAGKHLLLDKPVAGSVAAAQALADAVDEAGVQTMVLLSMRFSPRIRAFLDSVGEIGPVAAHYESIGAGFLEGPFSNSAWRHEGGILTDVGPHVVDLLSSILGPVVHASADVQGPFVRLALRHESGGFADAFLSATYRGQGRHGLRVYGPTAIAEPDPAIPDEDRWGIARREFVDSVRSGAAHPCDVHRGLEVQRVLATVGAG